MPHSREPVRITEVLIVTEHRLFADALRYLMCARHPRVTIAAACPGAELDRVGAMVRPDVMLLDVQVRQAAVTCERLRRWYPDAVVLCFGGDTSDTVATAAARDATLPSTHPTTIDELLEVVGTAIHNRRRGLYGRWDRAGHHHAGIDTSDLSSVRLSAREREIVSLLDLGLGNKQIAARLGITVATTKNHVHHILGKLTVRTRGQAAALVRAWRECRDDDVTG